MLALHEEQLPVVEPQPFAPWLQLSPYGVMVGAASWNASANWNASESRTAPSP